MYKKLICLVIALGVSSAVSAQIDTKRFGKGLRFVGEDSSFTLKLGFRFQNLYVGEWTKSNGSGMWKEYDGSFFVRRSRLKFDGFAYTPKLKYKLELGLSNRDISSKNTEEFRNAPNVILDAYVSYNFYKNFSIQFGQGKLPGNRERVISSGNLQFVDRSRLNSRFTIDRDAGLQLKHYHVVGNEFKIKEVIALSQGEGRNVTNGNHGGFDYTFRLELLPFGDFASKGDYVGSAIKREATPKLSLGFTYDHNTNAVRSGGQLGSFFKNADGDYLGKDLNVFFADLMFKYRGFSLMSEYAHKRTGDGVPEVTDAAGTLVGTFFTGRGVNTQLGYMLPSNWELAGRYTTINPFANVSSDEKQYTFGISKFISGHKLKVQTDFTYIDIVSGNDNLLWRTQVDIHF